jgi:2-oxoglutarate dehydrogenase E2 component (dihydrolipoamide succinyltransferase)
MKVEVVMPKMGESLQEGTIIRWIKKPGEAVERDEMILEISTDKVDTEVPSPVSGVLAAVFAKEEETVLVGTKIAEIETDASQAVSAPQVEAPTPAPASAPAPAPVMEQVVEAPASAPVASTGGSTIDLVMPKMGESLQEGTIVKWLKKVGEAVERDEMILEISTDKVDTEVPSPQAGVLVEILAKEEETVLVGTVIARISTGGSSAASAPAQAQTPAPAPVAAAPSVVAPAQVAQAAPALASAVSNVVVGSTFDIPRQKDGKFFSPLVRAIAKDNRVSLEELMSLSGTGADGRITRQDLEKYLANRGAAPTQAATIQAPTPAPAPAPAPVQAVATQVVTTQASVPAPVAAAPVYSGGSDFIEVIPMDRMRQLISAHMTMSKATSAHVTSVGEADVTNIVKFRDKFKNEFEKREGFKLTFTPFFAKAAVDGLKKFPMVNVSVDGKNILRHKRINLSFATALPDGNLIVPVIKSADALSLTGLARGVYDLSTRARNKQLNPDDIQGGTFTITNVGTFGTLFGTPVINQPQVGIFGIGAIKKRPVAMEVNGDWVVVVRDMAYVSITYDHRVIDGMLAGQYLQAVIQSLESMNESTVSW